MMSVICGIKKKKGTNEPIYKRETVTDIEDKCMVTKGGGRSDKMGDWT